MFHNKKLRIALIVIVLLTGFLALASNTVQVRENPTFLEKGLRIAASPFQSSFHAIHNGIDGIGSYFADKKALEAENKKLREQVDALHHQVARLEETQLENIRLKELLDYKEGMDKAYQLQLAETIAKKNNNLQYMITINKGNEDGVTAGMTVMNHYGLIGRVSSVLSGSAEVLLLPDHESAVGARVKSTREALGVVEGDGTAYIKAIPAVKELYESLTGDEKTGVAIVMKALEEPVRQIALNSGLEGSVILENILKNEKADYGFDAYNENYCNMFDAGIVDPTKVTRSALQNAASVAATVLTTESLVADIKEKADPAAAAAMGQMGGGMY